MIVRRERRIGDVGLLVVRTFGGEMFLLVEVADERELVVVVDAFEVVDVNELDLVDVTGVFGSNSTCIGEPNVKRRLTLDCTFGVDAARYADCFFCVL